MSLVALSKKLKSNKNKVLVGKTENKFIYFDSNVPKDKRVRELVMDDIIKPFPYIQPNANQRSATMIASLSGSGKSMLAVELIKRLRELRGNQKNPKTDEMEPKKVVVFTITQEIDPAFKDIPNFCWVHFSHPEFLQITLDMLKNNIVIFDDFTSIIDSKLQKYVNAFIADMLERARKMKIDMVVITHQLQQFHKTKAIIFECDGYFLNLQTTKNASIKFLKSYAELDKNDIDDFKNLDSSNMFQWTYLHKTFPQYYIHENKIKLI